MKFLSILFLISTVGLAFSANIKKDRVIDQKLNDEDPGTLEYDRAAFMGQEDAHETDELPPEEAKEVLRKIVLKMDKDNDGLITLDEMKERIQYSKMGHARRELEARMEDFDPDNTGYVTWDKYKDTTYGHMTEEEMDQAEEEHAVSYRGMMTRDKRRWDKADLTGDNVLSRDEMMAFLFPEEHPDMKDIVAMETFEDIDKNKDGKIEMQEYIGDLYNPEDYEEEPEWVEHEKKQFTEVRDANGDGVLDIEEVKKWIFPDDYDHIDAEARHLLYTCTNQENAKHLTMEDILEHHQNFVGSQITNYGADLKLRHDEF